MLRSLLAASLVSSVLAQSDTSFVLSGTNTALISSAVSASQYQTASEASYNLYTSTSSLSRSADYTYLSGQSSSTSSRLNQTVTTNGTTLVTPTATATLLTASSRNSTARSTSTAARPSNTQPCNGYAEFCNRGYGNITHVGAHNSPFDIRGNVASNQEYDVTTQLNDGVRMLQFQVHRPNDTSGLLLCHTSCDLLYAGTLESYLTEVTTWLDENPFDVVTILMGNYAYFGADNFSEPVLNSGIGKYLYVPPTVPMGLSQWPTLAEMILLQQRVVMMLDYDTNMTSMPWLLDEFSFMWETPFSPTERSFPCDVDRPPNQDRNISADRLYMANHNLNVAFEFLGASLDIPATTLLNETNAVTGYGSAGLASTNCTTIWDRPPNFILVDYYNRGSFEGSVFQVAADANGVTYDRDSCCGLTQRAENSAPGLNANFSLLVFIAGVIALSMF